LSGRALIEWAGTLQNSKADLELQLTDALIPYLPIKHPTEPYPIGEAFQVAIGDVELRMKLDKAENLPGLTNRGRSSKSGQVLLIEELKARGEHVEIQLDSGQRHTVSFRSPKTSDGIVDVRLVVHFTDEFFAWKGDGIRADGHEAKDVGHSALKSAMGSFLKRARKKIGKKYYYGFHCQGTLKKFKCPPKMPTQRVIPAAPTTPPTATSGVSTPTKRPPAPTAGKFKRPKPARASQASRPTRTPTASRNKRKSPSPASRLVEPARDRQRARDEARRGLRPEKRVNEEEPEDAPEEEVPTDEGRDEPDEDDPEAAEDDPRDDYEREEEFDEDGEPIDELDEPGEGEDEEGDEDLDFED
jgi:hypothetical protein